MRADGTLSAPACIRPAHQDFEIVMGQLGVGRCTLTSMTTLERHAFNLGRLLANFQALEFMLRLFLNQLPNARPIGILDGTDIYSLTVGSKVSESDITSYDSLGVLIDKYNAWAQANGHPQIDRSLVDVRDALAHGRVSAASPNDKLRLIKFSKPKNGMVTVMFNQRLSEEWFSSERRRLNNAMHVLQASQNTTPAYTRTR